MCSKEPFFMVGNLTIWRLPDDNAFFFEAGLTINADGAPDAYHPDNIGTDHLANAGRPATADEPANWWALVTDTGQRDGIPLIQGPDDSQPGFYISMTALEDRTKARNDPRRYVNSNEIPYVVLPGRPPEHRGGAKLGDFSVVLNRANGRLAYAIFADLGARGKIGEGSIALARALDINSNPRHGGVRAGIIYLFFPNSGNRRPRPVTEIEAKTESLFQAWGGLEKLKTCLCV